MRLSAGFIDKCVSRSGFQASALEKVARIGMLASDIARHPVLGTSLALKGGRALNLGFGAPKRLSVDLDYNYVGSPLKETMLQQRPEIEHAVVDLGRRSGYRVQLSSDAFAGRKIYLTFESAFGHDDRLEVDLNFLFRLPLGRLQKLPLWQPGELDSPTIQSVSTEELLAGKLLALLQRGAPRDAWDTANLRKIAPSIPASPSFKSLFVALSATLPRALQTYRQDHLRRSITDTALRHQLLPMLMTANTTIQAERLIREAWSVVRPMLDLNEEEQRYLSLMERGELHAECLYPHDPEMSSLIEAHPALQWKILNVRFHKGT